MEADKLTELLDSNVHIKTNINLTTAELLTFLATYNFIRTEKNGLKDTFFMNDTIDLMTWYNGKNPEFRNLREVNPEMPEFNLLFKKIIYDLLKMLVINKYPGRIIDPLFTNSNTKSSSYKLYNKDLDENDISKITELLGQINELIDEKYKYISSIETIIFYIKLMSGGFLQDYSNETFIEGLNVVVDKDIEPELTKHKCDRYFYGLRKLLDTPYLLYPTFHQLHPKYVLKNNVSTCYKFSN